MTYLSRQIVPDMDKSKIFEYVKADRFFADYLPHIKQYKNKIRGKNGRGNPIDFPESEKKEIKEKLEQLFKDIAKG